MLKKNQDIKLNIDGMTADGSGVAHFEGEAAFVRNTAIGDTVEAHIIKAKKNYAVGKLIRVISPSPDRTESDCPVSEKCGGCCYRHISYEAELKIKKQKVQDAFDRIGHLEVKMNDIIGSETLRYRNKAEYPVTIDTKEGEVLAGFYAFNSHRVVPAQDCMLQPAAFAVILDAIIRWVNENDISVYDETTGTGLLRHVYIRRAYHTGEMMVCLVINGKKIPNEAGFVEMLTGISDEIKTVVLNENREATNVILGDKCRILSGDGYINDILCGKKSRISPLSFYQVNTPQCERLYAKAAEYADLNGNEFVLDLYCGIGTVGLSMSDKAGRLIGVEIIPEAVEDAKVNAKINGIENAEFFCGDATEIGAKLKAENIEPDVILIDPPRKGMTPELIKNVADMDPKRIVYISCDPATLARDCGIFLNEGYEVKEATPVDMFPRTSHVETVVLLSKVCCSKS